MLRISYQDVLTASTSAQLTIGSRAETPDGRKWVYVKANAALAKGDIAITGAVVGVDTVSSSADNQNRIVYVTEASAGWTVGAYADDWMLVDDGTGAGQVAKIKTNTNDTLELYPEYALSAALDVADSDITIARPYHVDEAEVTSKKQNANGIAQCAIAASSYGWLLTYGPGVVTAGIALTATASFGTGDDTAGYATILATTEGSFDAQCLGYSLVANASADKGALVFVNIQ